MVVFQVLESVDTMKVLKVNHGKVKYIYEAKKCFFTYIFLILQHRSLVD